MDIDDLKNLGLTSNESKVYLSLIQFGRADARTLIGDTNLHKKVVYENLERLIEKGLIGFIIEDKKKVFQIVSPQSLVEFFDDSIAEQEKKREAAKKIATEIKQVQAKIHTSAEAIVYRGKQGVRTFYNELLEIGEPYVVFGAPERSIKIMDEFFWRNFNAKRSEKKMAAKLLFNQSTKKYGDSLKNKLTKVRYFEKDFEPYTETNIQKNRIAVIVWSDEPVIFIMIDEHVAESYRKYFEKMWSSSPE